MRGEGRSGRLSRILPLAAMLGIWAGGLWFVLALSPFPPVATLKHIAAFPNCGMARLVGLAPARRGEPGYYARHDADADGVACEPVPGPIPRVHRF